MRQEEVRQWFVKCFEDFLVKWIGGVCTGPTPRRPDQLVAGAGRASRWISMTTLPLDFCVPRGVGLESGLC